MPVKLKLERVRARPTPLWVILLGLAAAVAGLWMFFLMLGCLNG